MRLLKRKINLKNKYKKVFITKLKSKIEKFSNGFKLGGTDTVSNGSGSTYIYMAFAEAPLVTSDNIPATAR